MISHKLFGTQDFFAAPVIDNIFITTDGVGSKIELESWDTIGIDCVAMNVNDIICVGARPTGFVNYLKLPRKTTLEFDENVVPQIARGLLAGCNLAGVPLVGGETAIHGNEVDVSGTATGELIHHRPIYGQDIEADDIIIGIESSGIHSNGFTELRNNNIVIPKYFSKPTYIYNKLIVYLVEENLLTGMAHITGGGFNNLKRLRTNLIPSIDYDKILNWSNKHMVEIYNALMPLFEDMTYEHMKDCFNMGWGFVVVCNPDNVEMVGNIIKMFGYKYKILGYYG